LILNEKGVTFMKKVTYSIGILSFLLIMSLAYFASYQITLNRHNESNTQTDMLSESNLRAVDTIKDEIITSETKYILETYSINTSELTEEMQKVPVEFLGFTRDKLIAYLQSYDKNPTEEDLEKGFLNFSLVSFSNDTIVLRKTYEILYSYFIIDNNGFITIYKEDKKTLYEYTNISISILPDALREEVQKGMFLKDDEALYNFLENYTS